MSQPVQPILWLDSFFKSPSGQLINTVFHQPLPSEST